MAEYCDGTWHRHVFQHELKEIYECLKCGYQVEITDEMKAEALKDVNGESLNAVYMMWLTKKLQHKEQ